jgi:hypothetical protein
MITQNDGFFITTLRAVMGRFFHYPEVHNNILIILFQITNFLDTNYLIITADKLNLEEFKDLFDPYRSRLRTFCKFLNNLHLNILGNISDISKNGALEQYEPIMKDIMMDLKAFYRKTANSRKRLEDFKHRKLNEVEIHEVITRIGVNVTKYQKLIISLLESYFYDDIIEYLIVIAKTNMNGKDFISALAEKKKKNVDEVKRYVLAIIENSQAILINVMNSDDEDIPDLFCNQIVNLSILEFIFS